MTAFELSAHMSVRPGQLEGFKKQAAEIIRLTRERDTQTLRYDWFLTDDGTECEVRELYESPQGLIEHKAHIGAALKELFDKYADKHFMTIYGEPSRQLLDLVQSLHMEKQIRWFSFLDGLEEEAVGHGNNIARNESSGLPGPEAYRGRGRLPRQEPPPGR
jgi:quinol monooxygenase YgiN